jgi:hypothetical protein
VHNTDYFLLFGVSERLVPSSSSSHKRPVSHAFSRGKSREKRTSLYVRKILIEARGLRAFAVSPAATGGSQFRGENKNCSPMSPSLMCHRLCGVHPN